MDGDNVDGQIQGSLSGCLDFQVRPDYFVDRHCTGSWHLDESVLPWHDLTWVLSGRATYWMDDMRLDLEQGDFVYLPQGSLRRAVTDPDRPMHCLAINFNACGWEGESVGLPLPNRFHLAGNGRLPDLYGEFQTAWFERTPGFRLETQAALLRILREILLLREHPQPGGETAARLASVRNLLLERYAEPLSVEGLAREAGLHPVYFGQSFKKYAGMPVREYLNRIRIHKVGELLATGGYTVAEAAERCGFPDPYHFSRVCRKLTGKAPSRYYP